ncbi:hypothetical protein PsYK624_044340 [Phanerochaete sordida]|uniref:F-box domain-containing protein n=1 Tax=Phanerochaete sordida TaxID=48140 RepID=A0A9P3G500_9APHY|nr:hypothetical protein PsYK624_044340 [Phanerochaete sordida]
MWTHINFGSPNLARLFIERSRPLSLCAFVVSIPELPTPPFEQWSTEDTMLREALQRSRTLSLRLQVGSNLPASVVAQTAPLLEELTITTTSADAPMHKLAIDELFGGVRPQLRSLDLRGCHLPWRRGLYTGLTRLALSGALLALHPGADVLVALADSPGLEELALWFASAPGVLGVTQFTGSARPAPPLLLPRLRRLALRLPFYDTHYLLAALAPAPDVLADVHIVYPSGDLLGALAHLRVALPPPLFARVQDLRVARTRPASFEVAGTAQAQEGGDLRIHVEGHAQRLLKACAPLLEALTEGGGMPALRSVKVIDEGADGTAAESAVFAFSRLETVPCLTVGS